MRKLITILIHLFIIFFLVVFEITFVKLFPLPFNFLGIILPVIIYLVVIFGLNLGLWWAVFAGFFLDFYSLLPFGTIALALVITAFCIHYLFINLFTNRSLYSLLFLGFVGTLMYKMIIFGISFFPLLFNKGHQLYYLDFNLVKITFASIVLNLLFLSALFYLTNMFSKRLKPTYV
ncbi:MAG: rod shape-determining protein MreD [Patescibacteria group bacterium]|nr:rod shape-determining protein MreD [Patescibacteria group bacterium]